MSHSPIKQGEIYELEITSLTSEGDGVGRFQGLAIFVAGALPDELVTAKISQVKKRYAKANLVSIIKASPDRRHPPCKFFGRCGGCQLMHLDYAKQLKAKRDQVKGAFKRIGHLEGVKINACYPSPQQYNYRNKVMLPITWTNAECKMGFFKQKSHQVIDIDTCAIHNELGDRLLGVIREHISPVVSNIQQVVIKTAINTQQVLVIIVSPEKNPKQLASIAKLIMIKCPEVKGVLQNTPPKYKRAVFGKQWISLAGCSRIQEKMCGLTFEISGASFFQVNTPQAEHLYEEVVKLSGVTTDSIVLDAYCGVGTLSLILAKHVKHVYGIEIVPDAVKDANSNAALNSLANCTFSCGLAEKLIQRHSSVDTVLLNPPRQGCDQKVLHSLLGSLPEKIVYISCNPTTLARDLSILAECYTIDTVQPFDMFPQTTHVETVVTLSPSR